MCFAALNIMYFKLQHRFQNFQKEELYVAQSKKNTHSRETILILRRPTSAARRQYRSWLEHVLPRQHVSRRSAFPQGTTTCRRTCRLGSRIKLRRRAALHSRRFLVESKGPPTSAHLSRARKADTRRCRRASRGRRCRGAAAPAWLQQ
jgi:hypothetical protein